MVIRRKRVVAAVLITAGLTLAPASAAFAGGDDHHGGGGAGCNAGRGNGSETTPANDCDPGNSGGVNNGGD